MELRKKLLYSGAVAALATSSVLAPSVATANDDDSGRDAPEAELLVDGLDGAVGSTIGPDGDLYVTQGTEGKVTRIDPWSGDTSTFAEGLPEPAGEYGGAVDIAFLDDTAYVLVSLVDEEVGGDGKNGIYRIDDEDDHERIADVSQWNRDHLPDDEDLYDLKSGNPFAIHAVHEGFLVTDGNQNRLLHISEDGDDIEELVQFENVVPTGIEVDRKKIYIAQAGPVPHEPEDGRVVSLDYRDDFDEEEVASGAPLLVDVEFGKCDRLYALSNGESPEDAGPAEPAEEDTGELLEVTDDGDLEAVVEDLNLPSSVDFIGDTAFITSLAGEVWRVDDVGGDCDSHHDDGDDDHGDSEGRHHDEEHDDD
jgi:hypothetical protein